MSPHQDALIHLNKHPKPSRDSLPHSIPITEPVQLEAPFPQNVPNPRLHHQTPRHVDRRLHQLLREPPHPPRHRSLRRHAPSGLQAPVYPPWITWNRHTYGRRRAADRLRRGHGAGIRGRGGVRRVAGGVAEGWRRGEDRGG